MDPISGGLALTSKKKEPDCAAVCGKVLTFVQSVTLRLSDDVYQKFSQMAREENRSMANLVETLALQKLTEEIFTDTFETEEILANSALMNKLKRGHMQAELRKGRFVE